ncbi:MAG: hypothetical protein SF123_19590 [Chloroflexota bacterium]|nr:hypothetical protein [Chloroflexota bacterium]
MEETRDKDYNPVAARQSVQGRANPDPNGFDYSLPFLVMLQSAMAHDGMPPWTPFPRKRDMALNKFYMGEPQLVGAVYSLTARIKALGIKIEGGRNQKAYAQAMLNDAHLGAGVREFTGSLATDWLTKDNGMFFELIGRGNPSQALTSKVTGVAALDPIQCMRTGDPRYPVIYTNPTTGEHHKLHHTRVVAAASMRQTQEQARGVGYCAVSRALKWSKYFADVLIYKHERLRGQVPALGYGSGFTRKVFEEALQHQSVKDKGDGFAVFQNIPFLLSPGAGNTSSNTTLGLLELASLGDSFNFADELNMYMQSMALTFGVDTREFWAATESGATKADATVQHLKARGKGLGDLITTIESAINQALPEGVIFSFEFQDDEQDAQRANIHALHVANFKSLKQSGIITQKTAENHLVDLGVLKPHLLAQDVEVADAAPVSDLSDDQSGINEDTEDTEDDAPSDAEQDDVEPNDDEEDEDSPPPRGRRGKRLESGNYQRRGKVSIRPKAAAFVPAEKAIADTRAEFDVEFGALLAAGIERDLKKSDWVKEAYTLLEYFIRRAGMDGLADGGVQTDTFDPEEETAVDAIVTEQLQYVGGLADALYASKPTLDANSIPTKLSLWWNGSVYPAYMAMRAAADANGMYEWRRGGTKDSCKDCRRLDGQRHRMKTWTRRGWIPRSKKLACGGRRCACDLVRVTGRAYGRF